METILWLGVAVKISRRGEGVTTKFGYVCVVLTRPGGHHKNGKKRRKTG